MFQDTNRYVIPFPELSKEYQNQYYDKEYQIELNERLEKQYIELKGLGIDYLEDEENIDSTIYQNIILYFNDNYIPIPQYEALLQNDKECKLFGNMIYQFLAVDLIKVLIPKTIGVANKTSCLDLLSFDAEIWRYYLIQVLVNIINSYKQVRQTSDNVELKFEQFKYSFYIDLLDNDITKFVESFLIPVLNSYSIQIDSRG